MTKEGKALREKAKMIPKDIVSELGISTENISSLRDSLQNLTTHIHELNQ